MTKPSEQRQEMMKPGWTPQEFIDETIANVRAQVGTGRVLCALSGGVDSTICAALVGRAVGKQLTCVIVDHGCMRKNEVADVVKVLRQHIDSEIIAVDAEARFLAELDGVSEPERKRKIIGETFIRVFEEQAEKLGAVDYLLQGTIYPDILESGQEGGKLVKSHHNVGGMPETMKFKGLVEPVRLLYKDEVRRIGTALGLPDALVWRQPFPGPGLAVRCLGALTKPRLDTLREADQIFRDEIAKAGLDRDIWQYFAIMTEMQTVGVVDGARSYQHVVALRAITSTDAMQATYYPLPHELLAYISQRITSEVANVGRVVYDITSKPPATIEWE